MRVATVYGVASLAVLAAIATPAYAVDGVVLINQAAALNGNVTPSDAAGFPVTISAPGSYRLSSNLIVPDGNTTAIEVLVSEVTIDLNGFSIIGASCVGFGAPCNPTGTGAGIEAPFFVDNVKVSNGTIRGMGSHGIILLGFSHAVERVHAKDNAGAGIIAGGLVDHCDARDNGLDGIVADSVIASSARGNGGKGFDVSLSIIDSTAAFNGQQGIFARCAALVASTSAQFNAGGDIFTVGSGCVRANNVPAP
jgi:hypothetical protein